MGEVIAIALCCLLGAWIFQSIRNEFLAGEIRVIISRTKAVLTILEGQDRARTASVDRVVAEIKDVKRDTVRAADVALQARDVAAVAIEKVPEKVAALLKPGESGVEWRPGDPERRQM